METKRVAERSQPNSPSRVFPVRTLGTGARQWRALAHAGAKLGAATGYGEQGSHIQAESSSARRNTGSSRAGSCPSQQRPQLSPRGLQRKSLLPRSLQAQLPNRLAALPFLSWEPESAPSSYTETTFPELTSTACVPCPQNGSKVGPRYLCDIKCPSIHFPVEINSGPDYHHLLTLCVCV